MDESEKIDPEYLKSFNQGYLLAKHEPQLAKKITEALPETQRAKGFKGGVDEFAKEKNNELTPKWLQKDRLSKLDRTEDRELERD